MVDLTIIYSIWFTAKIVYLENTVILCEIIQFSIAYLLSSVIFKLYFLNILFFL